MSKTNSECGNAVAGIMNKNAEENPMQIDPAIRLLLISSSVVYGRGYLDHAEDEIRKHLHGIRRILFIPYALHNYESYAQKARERFQGMGLELESVHRAADAHQAVLSAEALFIGGGNTFRLLKALYEHLLPDAIREKVLSGMPYVGSSAGTVVAGPTIRTTNDMPIVEAPSLAALGLIPFQINPHYLDAEPDSRHMGETREERLLQYLEENSTPVVGLREGAMLCVSEGSVTLRGSAGARIFRRLRDPVEIEPGADLLESLP
jgi:dipeptidase E